MRKHCLIIGCIGGLVLMPLVIDTCADDQSLPMQTSISEPTAADGAARELAELSRPLRDWAGRAGKPAAAVGCGTRHRHCVEDRFAQTRHEFADRLERADIPDRR